MMDKMTVGGMVEAIRSAFTSEYGELWVGNRVSTTFDVHETGEPGVLLVRWADGTAFTVAVKEVPVE